MGVTWGLYVPFSAYARDDDCYSRFVDVADTLIDYHSRFDEPTKEWTLLKIASTVLRSARPAVLLIETVKTC